MTRKLSDWSKPGEKPRMVGVWETDFLGGVYQYFNGERFRIAGYTPKEAWLFRRESSRCNQSAVRFRGLAEKPK